MTLKLYAGTAIAYEYAVWADTKRDAQALLGREVEVSSQSTNKNLKAIITDRAKVYCRALIDGADWYILQNKS